MATLRTAPPASTCPAAPYRCCCGLGPGPLPPGPVLDIGCAVGGGVFGLCALTDGPVLGIDVNWPLLKIARHACDTGRVTFPVRQSGVHYDRRSGLLPGADRHRADVWVADALALPFAAGTFGQAVSLNVLDCISDPVRMVSELARSLAPGGGYLVSTPLRLGKPCHPCAPLDCGY